MIVVVHALPRLAHRGLHDHARFAGFRAAQVIKLALIQGEPEATTGGPHHALMARVAGGTLSDGDGRAELQRRRTGNSRTPSPIRR